MARTTIPVSIKGREEVPYALRQIADLRGLEIADVLRQAVEIAYGEEFTSGVEEYKKLLKKRARLFETS